MRYLLRMIHDFVAIFGVFRMGFLRDEIFTRCDHDQNLSQYTL